MTNNYGIETTRLHPDFAVLNALRGSTSDRYPLAVRQWLIAIRLLFAES
jgi:hypothetical protein